MKSPVKVRRVGLVLLFAAALATAACGSTVPLAQRRAAGSNAVEATATSVPNGDVAAADGSTTGATGSGAAPGAASTSRSGRATSLPSVSAAAPALAAKAPILLGLPYVDQQEGSTITGAIGNGLATGDIKAMVDALVDDLNTRGGVLGHKVSVVHYRINVSSTQAQYEQGACSAFTQDNHVLVALGAGASANYLSCIAKGGAAVVGPDWSNLLQADYDQLKWVLQPDAIALDRLARLQAEHFVAMGLFQSTQPVKVGVLYFDLPAFTAAEKVLERELAKRGVTVSTRQAFSYVGETSDIGRNQSAVQSAVLRFRSEGVTHVIGVETNAWLIGFFGLGAANQGYYPRYGYTSDEVLSNVAANVPAKALEGARFIGWWPAQDLVDTKQYPQPAQACLDFMRKKGMALDTGNQRADALGACEAVQFTASAIAAGGEPVSRASLLAGARTMSGYASTNTFQLRVTNQNFDGVSAIRQGAWNAACGCFAYTSGLIPVG